MTSKKIIERLITKSWYIETKTNHEEALVLNACLDAEIIWCNAREINNYLPNFEYKFIGLPTCDCGISHCYEPSYYKCNECEDITEWFFKEINSDDIEKLAPQNEQQEHMVQILLAVMQKKCVEVRRRHGENTWYNWGIPTNIKSLHLNETEVEYRIKPKNEPTPLPIPDELWKLMNKKLNRAVLIGKESKNVIAFFPDDEDDEITTPECNHQWFDDDSFLEYYLVEAKVFNINTDGIDWRLSLTKRPEGL